MSWVSSSRSRTAAPLWSATRRAGVRVAGRGSALRQANWLLLGSVLALILFGTLVVWSATEPSLIQQGVSPRAFLAKQMLNVVLGVILMLVVSSLDTRHIKLLAPVLYVVTCLGVLAVLSPLGTSVNGARSWISLGAGFQVEPSEFGKLAVILMTAMILSELRPNERRPAAKAIAIAAGVGAVPILLVVAEPDLGVTIVLLVLLVGLIALSGVRLRWLVGMAVAGVAGAIAVFQLHLLKAYQLSRLTSFINPSADPLGTGYSTAQAKIAIGSGGMYGTGLFHSQLIAGNFVPEQNTDFIFAVVGNELGFVGAMIIIGLLGLLLFSALRIASRAENQFGMLVASGIAIWFAVQSFVNIGMTIGIMPVTGLPLPFVSYGGSAMFADMIAVGLLQSIHRRRNVFAGGLAPGSRLGRLPGRT